MKIDITLTHPGQVLGEQIRGFVTAKAILIYTRTVTTYSTVNKRRVAHHHTVTEHVNTKVYQSPDFPVIEELHNHNISLTTELAPGKYDYPFVFQLPQGLPSSQFFTGRNVSVTYQISAKVISKNNSTTKSSGFVLPVCISTQRHIPRPKMFVDNTAPLSIQLAIDDEIPAVGDVVTGTLQLRNDSQHNVTMTASFCAVHTYRNTRCEVFSGTTAFPVFGPRSTNSAPFNMSVPIDIPLSISNDPFNVSNYIKIDGSYGGKSFQMLCPIQIGCDMIDPRMMCERAAVFGGRRDFTKATAFYGKHFRVPPHYENITNPNLPIGVEEIEGVDGQNYFVSHFSRQCSFTPDMQNGCNIPYPSYNSAMLPPGWAMGMDYGETYFIDHNTRSTTWVDPRPMEQRIVPHIALNKTATFTVEIIKATGLPILGWGFPDPYACVWDEKQKWVSTGVVPKSIDPVFTKNNTLSFKVEKDRRNVMVYLYDKHKITYDVFMGAINFDLQYFPPDVSIQDWFQLSCFGEKETAITGKVLMKVCYRVNEDVNNVAVDIIGKSPLLQDYYPYTHFIMDQIEKQNKARTEKKLPENSMMMCEGKIICRNPI
ncbi:hypothetical protein EIN_329180 [Entamoeba invadens IP1]|uniref:WW domain-containing protein n=1 Tax=Entamoeba invadens IP1 TaxID=370355 RepID=A0A0A1U3N0_ENTIV|nr:hypothetical protein EIN_329180 [Entamoeba invadens IP1]ELP86191.1 hypothetical protein EIN_329180 [Entamoeba invadens IP1]|eukprot:XP_004185537.1 hypothetical protein EIN_329180 [Entamoeba invadens IP1]